ncbi:MAG: PD-(D/E)XK nuclease family transposase [Cyclobacteriaceae bacterium]
MPEGILKEEELGTNFDKWMFILKNLHQLERIPEKLQTKIFEKLFKAAEISNLSPEEMKEYQESLKNHWDQYSILETAKNEAKEEGKLEGKIEIAINLIKEGNDNYFISKITGLSIHKIEELRQRQKSN